MIRFVVSLMFVLACGQALASTMPLNNLDQEDNIKVITNVSPRDFQKIIGDIAQRFSPIIRRHGAELKVNYLWTDPTVNASAQEDGNTWILNMYGGLARRKEITKDGFALVVCHELGHHLGGYPFKGPMWAAAEGQSDYFATQVCARQIWAHDQAENANHRATVDPIAKTACDRAWRNQMQRDLCYRTADAGESLANLLNFLHQATRPVSYRKFPTTKVSETYIAHPEAPCRLETYLAGALCRRNFNLDVIPGSALNTGGGALMDEEKEAALYSCEEMGSSFDGSRPRCWFHPLLGSWR